MIFSATTFLAPDSKRSPAVGVGSAAYAGVLLGFALGCKVSFGLVLVVVLCWVLFSRSLATHFSDRLRVSAIILFASVITGGVWHVRNLVLTGNPVFPAQLGPFAGPFTQADQSRTKLIAWILERPTDLTQWSAIVSALSDWPPSLFALCFAGYVWGIWQVLRSKVHGHQSPLRALLLLIGLVVAVSYFVVPFQRHIMKSMAFSRHKFDSSSHRMWWGFSFLAAYLRHLIVEGCSLLLLLSWRLFPHGVGNPWLDWFSSYAGWYFHLSYTCSSLHSRTPT